MNNCYCIILARGGSKGLPRKNLKQIAGRSLLARAIDAGRAAELVVVSSDDEEILEEAERCGAMGIRRPAELSSDGASSESGLLHAIDTLARSGKRSQFTLMIQCTSPFVVVEDVTSVIESLVSGKYDSVFTGFSTHSFIWRYNKAVVVGVNHDASVRLRRQDREVEIEENGAVYGFSTDGFLAAKHRFFGRTGVVLMPKIRSVEIDSLEDLHFAAALSTVIEANSVSRPLETGLDGL